MQQYLLFWALWHTELYDAQSYTETMRTPEDIEFSILALESSGEDRSQYTSRTKSDFEGHDAAILNRIGRPVGMNVRGSNSEVAP